MASNASSRSGFLQDGVNLIFPDGKLSASPALTFAIVVLPLIAILLKKLVYPSFDPREPPVIRPKIPVIGHIIDLIRDSPGFHLRLYKERALPISTLPMLTGKMYTINSPSLISAAMRHKDISFDPFMVEFAVGAMGMLPNHFELYSQESKLRDIVHVIHSSLMGDPLYRMNVLALLDIAQVLNGIKPGSTLNIPDINHWFRNVISMATWKALYGENNPLTPEVIPLMWEFEQALLLLSLNVAPSLLARKGLAARTKIQQEFLVPYYVAHLDKGPEVSAIIKGRAALARQEGIPDHELGIVEFTIPWVSTTNTIPTAFWFFVNVFSRPDHVERVRKEVAAFTTITERPGGRSASIDITKLEKGCVFLAACYRETLRMYNDNTGNRRVMKDTTIRDTNDREYLLTKGTNLQWQAGVNQLDEANFGPDASIFDAERWIDPSAQQEKRQRSAMMPFGGGKNLCPGRHFALAENLGFVAACALGFEATGVTVPPVDAVLPGGAMRQPKWGGIDRSVDIKRREGWEDVEWTFSC